MSSRPFTPDRRAFVDTAAYYALVDADDANHAAARTILTELRAQHFCLVTTNFVLAETHALVLNRLGRELALRILDDNAHSAALTLVRVTPADEHRAAAIIRQYTDKRFSSTSARKTASMS